MATSNKTTWSVSDLPRTLQQMAYEREAQAYLASLPPEHFMEATPQATQRKITLESLDLVTANRPEVHVFNELLVLFPVRGLDRPQKVVPDNMVVLSTLPIEATNSFNVPLEPERPFLTLEYVSPSNPRKDYEDSFRKYERELKVPYHLIFRPDTQELTLYCHNRRRLVVVEPNEQGRYAIPRIELEVAILDRWVRYWYQGRLLPLPAELQSRLNTALRRAEEQERLADAERRRAEEQERIAVAERSRAEEQERLATAERRRADEEKHRADEEKIRADDLQRRLEAAERELAARRQLPEQS